MERHLTPAWPPSPHIEAGADVVGHFRQDDDDAVTVDFIQHARRFPGAGTAVVAASGLLRLFAGRGAEGDRRGRPVELRIVHKIPRCDDVDSSCA